MNDISKRISKLNDQHALLMTVLEEGYFTLKQQQELVENIEASPLEDDDLIEFVSTQGTIYPNKKVAIKIAEQMLSSGKKDLVANLKTVEKINNEIHKIVTECEKEIKGE